MEASCVRPWAELDLKEGQALGVCLVVGPPFLQTPRLRNRKGHGSPGDQRGRTGCVGQIWLRSGAGGASQIWPWPSLVGLSGDLGRGGRDPEPGKPICLGTHPRAPWVWPRDGKPHGKMLLLPEDCGGGIIAALKRRERQSEDLGWPGTDTRGRGRSAQMTRVTYGFARLQGWGCGEESGQSSWSRGAASASAQCGVRGAAEAPGAVGSGWSHPTSPCGATFLQGTQGCGGLPSTPGESPLPRPTFPPQQRGRVTLMRSASLGSRVPGEGLPSHPPRRSPRAMGFCLHGAPTVAVPWHRGQPGFSLSRGHQG